MYKKQEIKVPRFKESEGFCTSKRLSKIMSKIKALNTEPEIKLRKVLWNIGLRYRKNVKYLPGKPDIVINKFKLIIFVDGDFWHGYEWNIKKMKLKSNRAYWIPKIERNIQRDKEQTKELEIMGYRVLRFWEHEILKDFGDCVQKVLTCIQK